MDALVSCCEEEVVVMVLDNLPLLPDFVVASLFLFMQCIPFLLLLVVSSSNILYDSRLNVGYVLLLLLLLLGEVTELL